MSSLRARFGLQGLERHGVTLADQPGLVMKGKQLFFYSMTHRPPAGTEDPLAFLKAQFAKALDVGRDSELADLHLYYLDADGRAILSFPAKLPVSPTLRIGTKLFDTIPVVSLKVVRRYEALGRTGIRFRNKEEIRDPYTAFEMFQTAYQMGWGGQFFARDPDARAAIFRHFDPVRSGLIRVEEKLTNLSFTVQLFQEAPGQDLIAYRPVKTSLESATLDEALAWS